MGPDEPTAEDGDCPRPTDKDEPSKVPDFAPNEPTDGRERGDWKSRYSERSARLQIALEAVYVFVVIAFGLAGQLVMVTQWPRASTNLSPEQWQNLSPFVVAFLAGMVGGALFSTKWLYHTVAHGTWNADRILWRIFTPLLSGGAALTIILLSAGHVIPLFGADIVRTNAGAAGVALLVGYFSDRTFSHLENFAEGQLGSLKRNESKSNSDESDTAGKEEAK